MCIVGEFMNKENCKIIKEMYDDLKKEYAEQSALLDNKRSRILEIDSYVESILNKEQNDLQVFLILLFRIDTRDNNKRLPLM